MSKEYSTVTGIHLDVRSGGALAAAAALGLFGMAVFAGSLHAGEAEAADVGALAGVEEATDGGAPCVASETVMCLQEGRYAVTVDFTANGETKPAKVARPRTDDSGLFYFFQPNNWEMLLKVLDGCGVNQHHWVFAASATDVGLHLVVRDTTSDASKTYTKEPGEAAPAITDVGAFPDACGSTG